MIMAHTKNKTKYWRRPGTGFVLNQQDPVKVTDADGVETVQMVDRPVVIQGRDLRNVLSNQGKAPKMASDLLDNLIKKNFPVTINNVNNVTKNEVTL